MTPATLRAALARLDWTQAEAARQLGVRGGRRRISEWTRGVRPVPPYIAAAVRLALELRECRQGRGG